MREHRNIKLGDHTHLISRYRRKVSQMLASETNRMHKVLDDGGVKLGAVVSDINGVSPRALVAGLIEGKPLVKDRIVQTAVKRVTEPIFEKDFLPTSTGFRPGKGCKDALREVDKSLKEGYIHVVDADLKGYFDITPQGAVISPLLANLTLHPWTKEWQS